MFAPGIGSKEIFLNLFCDIFSTKLLNILTPPISLDFELSHLTAFLFLREILDITFFEGSNNWASALAKSLAPSIELSMHLATFLLMSVFLSLLNITVIGLPFSWILLLIKS